MSIIIEQTPLYKFLPVGQDIIFTVSSDTIVATKFNVKFVARVYVSTELSTLYDSSSIVANLKVTPNNKGVAIFSLEPILSSYVNPLHTGVIYDGASFSIASEFKNVAYSIDTPHPIHIIDKYCNSKNNIRYFSIDFNIEYFNSATSNNRLSFLKYVKGLPYLFFNGVLDYNDPLQISDKMYGYNLNEPKLVLNNFYGSLGKFISNAPLEQYARLEDYGTLSFFNWLNITDNGFQIGTDDATKPAVKSVLFKLYNIANQLLASIDVDCTHPNGGYFHPSDFSYTRLMFLGAFPANLDNWSSTWDLHKANISYYNIQAYDDEDEPISQLYKINIIDSSCKGFEPIRLTWLNQWGTWDYYTFNKKSIKSLQTNRTNYTQQSGTWNNKVFEIHGYKGGKKNFRVNTKKLITVNTDFVKEEEALWFEDLINSTDVYILKGYNSASNDFRTGIINKYVEPVTVTTSSYIRKTKANDKLIQYTFELEKTHNKRTQTV